MKTLLSITVFVLCLLSLPVQGQKAFDVVVKGKGEPVLLFPGFGCTAQVWDGVVDMFKKVIAVDALPSTAAVMIPNYTGE